MSGALQAWYSAAQLDALAARGAVLSEELELSRLTRLRELLATGVGRVAATFEFAPRKPGWVPVELRFETRVALTCQRCLEPLELHLDERIELGIIESASLEEGLPEGCVAVVLEDERVSPIELLEDELLVSLPLVPRHDSITECGSLARDDARPYVVGETDPQDPASPASH